MRKSIGRNLVLGLVTAVLLAGACKSGGDKVELTDGNAAAAAAAKRTADPGTVRFALRYDAERGTPINVTGEGSFDFDKALGGMRVKLAEQETNVVIAGDTIYGKLPGILGQGPKPWLAFNATNGNSLLGGLDQLVKLADPRQELSRLGLASDMKKVGTEKIRGVDTVHFQGIVDLSDAALAKLPAAVRTEARELREEFGLQSYPIDLWLDNAGRVRRLQSALSGKEGDQPVTVKTRIDLFSFGDKITVTIPPASQVQDASEFGVPTDSSTP